MLALPARHLWASAFRFIPCMFMFVPTTLVLAQPVTADTIITTRRDTLDSPHKHSQLPVQVAGIAASYVIFDAVVVFLLLFVGRRLRREAHSSNYSLEMVMLDPSRKLAETSVDPSPVSDYSVDSQIPSPVKQHAWNNMSWSTTSVKGHKGHAASMNSSVATIDESVVSADRRRAQEEMEYLYAAVMEHDAKKVSAHTSPVADDKSPDSPLASPRFPDPQHKAYPLQPQYQAPLSPQQASMPLSPRQGSMPLSPREENMATNKSRTSKRLSKLSNLSIFNPGSRSSSGSNKVKSPTSVRDLPISPPVKSPELVKTATYYQESQPLSPRIYNPGPPPTAPLPNSNSMQSPRGFTLQAVATPNTATMRTNVPPPLSINSSNSTLPFRNQFNPPQSAPHTKTTILERPVNAHGGPRTGMPTPYSPYMPFTPLTPLTPSRLVTKRDRKKQSKSQGLKVLHEDDMVKNDDELWGL